MTNCTDKATWHHVNKQLTVFYNPPLLPFYTFTAKLNQKKFIVFWNYVQTCCKIYQKTFSSFGDPSPEIYFHFSQYSCPMACVLIPSSVSGTVNSAGAWERAAPSLLKQQRLSPNEESYCLMRELINTYGCHSLIRRYTHTHTILTHTHTYIQLHKYVFELDHKEERQWEES